MKLLILLLPSVIFRNIVRLAMNLPSELALQSTLSFLGSERGVYEAMYVNERGRKTGEELSKGRGGSKKTY